MHLTLINPPRSFTGRSGITFSHCLGILYIASYARSKGHRVTVIDALAEGRRHIETIAHGRLRGHLKAGLNNRQILSRIPEDTDLIGVSVPFSHAAHIAHKLIRDIKRARPGVPLVMGGVYPSTQPELALTSHADYIALGEGEVPASDLLEYLGKAQEGPLPQGVVPAGRPEMLESVSPCHVPDVDSLPPPARDLLPFDKYVTCSQRRVHGWRAASIITSRGCPFDCEFCSVHPVVGYRWRPHSSEHVLAEIDELVGRYGVNMLEIEDDNFTLRRDRATAILEGIIERNQKGRKLCWCTPNGLRIDTVDDALLQVIKRSNCCGINLGLEHGDDDVLKSMNKKLSLVKVLETARAIHQLGIPCTFFAMYGYPGETRERFENAVSYYARIRAVCPQSHFCFLIAQPYPGTRLFKRAVGEGWLSPREFATVEDIGQFNSAEAVWFETPDFDQEEIRRRGRLLHKVFCSRLVYYRHRARESLPRGLFDAMIAGYRMGESVRDKLLGVHHQG